MKLRFLVAGLLCSTQVFAQLCDNEIALTAFNDRYEVDLADQSVATDLATGLVWNRCVEGYTFNDQGTTDDISDDTCDLPAVLTDEDEDNDDDDSAQIGWNWLQAFQRAEEQVIATNEEWRIPNVKELVSLVEHACSSPSINTDIFPAFFTVSTTTTTVTDDDGVESELLLFFFSAATSSSLWSSTPDANTESNAWTVSFSDGSNSTASKFSGLFLRLVRD